MTDWHSVELILEDYCGWYTDRFGIGEADVDICGSEVRRIALPSWEGDLPRHVTLYIRPNSKSGQFQLVCDSGDSEARIWWGPKESDVLPERFRSWLVDDCGIRYGDCFDAEIEVYD